MLDIAPIPREWRETQQEQTKQQKAEQKALEKAEKARDKVDQKAHRKAEKAKRKAEKKAAKAKKKAEKQAKQQSQNLSLATPQTVTTIQVPAERAAEATQAAMPTGVVLAVCASLLVCFASAWLYGKRRTNPAGA